MKKTIKVEKSFCDVCSNEASGFYSCINCGKEFCYDCMKTKAVEYTHAVHFSGSDDGLYCLECDEELKRSGDALHSAYLSIKNLRAEEKRFYVSFKQRCEEAENKIKSMLK